MWNINSISHIRSNTCGLHFAMCQIYVRVFSPETFLKAETLLFPPRLVFHLADQTSVSREWKESEEINNTWTQMWNSCAPFFFFFLFFSTHCSRFFGISAICPGMSAKEEKRPILFLCSAGLEGLPGYHRLCANTRTNKRTVADYIKTLLHSYIHTESMTN